MSATAAGARSTCACGGRGEAFPLELRHSLHVMRGLDPRIHPFREMMDCRVKPGNDDG